VVAIALVLLWPVVQVTLYSFQNYGLPQTDGAAPVPLVAPGLVATSIFSFITAYNEFIVALTFLGQAHSDYTLPIYVTFFFTRGGAQWGPIMAASTLYTIPVVLFFLIVQRRMTSGLVAGAVKG
jgi:N,N'-diacetylchitobiose transport system permease protein